VAVEKILCYYSIFEDNEKLNKFNLNGIYLIKFEGFALDLVLYFTKSGALICSDMLCIMHMGYIHPLEEFGWRRYTMMSNTTDREQP
jgi:hypothetical protein